MSKHFNGVQTHSKNGDQYLKDTTSRSVENFNDTPLNEPLTDLLFEARKAKENMQRQINQEKEFYKRRMWLRRLNDEQ